MAVTAYIVNLAKFDLIPVHLITDKIYYFPDGDPYNINFEQAGL